MTGASSSIMVFSDLRRAAPSLMIYMWDKREIPATVSGVVDPESDPDPTKVISAYMEIILKNVL